jgi:hypothetical protein
MLDDRSQGVADPMWEAARRIKKLEDTNRALREMIVMMAGAHNQVCKVLVEASETLVKAREMLK